MVRESQSLPYICLSLTSRESGTSDGHDFLLLRPFPRASGKWSAVLSSMWRGPIKIIDRQMAAVDLSIHDSHAIMLLYI